MKIIKTSTEQEVMSDTGLVIEKSIEKIEQVNAENGMKSKKLLSVDTDLNMYNKSEEDEEEAGFVDTVKSWAQQKLAREG